MVAVPAQPKAVAVDAGGGFERPDALLDQRMGRRGNVMFKSDGLAPIGNPTAHGNPVRAMRVTQHMGTKSVRFQASRWKLPPNFAAIARAERLRKWAFHPSGHKHREVLLRCRQLTGNGLWRPRRTISQHRGGRCSGASRTHWGGCSTRWSTRAAANARCWWCWPATRRCGLFTGSSPRAARTCISTLASSTRGRWTRSGRRQNIRRWRPWLVRAWFAVFPRADWAYYLFAMVVATAALWFGWRLMERYLEVREAGHRARAINIHSGLQLPRTEVQQQRYVVADLGGDDLAVPARLSRPDAQTTRRWRDSRPVPPC